MDIEQEIKNIFGGVTVTVSEENKQWAIWLALYYLFYVKTGRVIFNQSHFEYLAKPMTKSRRLGEYSRGFTYDKRYEIFGYYLELSNVTDWRARQVFGHETGNNIYYWADGGDYYLHYVTDNSIVDFWNWPIVYEDANGTMTPHENDDIIGTDIVDDPYDGTTETITPIVDGARQDPDTPINPVVYQSLIQDFFKDFGVFFKNIIIFFSNGAEPFAVEQNVDILDTKDTRDTTTSRSKQKG